MTRGAAWDQVSSVGNGYPVTVRARRPLKRESVTRDELGESLRYAGGLHHLQRVRCARNHALLGVWPPLANSLACFLVERQRRTSHHEEHRLPDLLCSARVELPRSDAGQLELEEGAGV